jgi:hypothetical protein
VLAPSPVFAQNPQVPTFTGAKLDASPKAQPIDGRVNDPIWQTVQPYTTFTQQDPIEGAPATEKTEIRIIVGKGTVYVGHYRVRQRFRRRSSCRSRGATRH